MPEMSEFEILDMLVDQRQDINERLIEFIIESKLGPEVQEAIEEHIKWEWWKWAQIVGRKRG